MQNDRINLSYYVNPSTATTLFNTFLDLPDKEITLRLGPERAGKTRAGICAPRITDSVCQLLEIIARDGEVE